MIIIHDQQIILQCYWSKDSAFIPEHPFQTLEIDETPTNLPKLKDIAQAITLYPDSGYAIENNQVIFNGQPIAFDVDADRKQLKDAYDAMIARLEQIQAAANPTNAQIIAAVKDEALYMERIMKVLRKMLA